MIYVNQIYIFYYRTNFLAVLGAPGVDAMKTKSNHIMEVNQTLGIEAARRSIIDEIQYTFESNNMIIDLRHMMLLADLMTYKVQYSSCDFHFTMIAALSVRSLPQISLRANVHGGCVDALSRVKFWASLDTALRK
jgi:hypothetical protein